ncbi:MAG: hypothetical protein AAB453_00155 [Patescibacteria group bacterium]
MSHEKYEDGFGNKVLGDSLAVSYEKGQAEEKQAEKILFGKLIGELRFADAEALCRARDLDFKDLVSKQSLSYLEANQK